MFKWCALLLIVAIAGWGADATERVSPGAEASMPPHAEGTFVQRKTLADVEVTVTSKGKFRFEKGKFFEWNTLEPLPSQFVATPTNYVITVNGKSRAHRLQNDVNSIAKIFEIKEVKDFVKQVKATPSTGFPEKVMVEFKNGDRLEITMTQARGAGK